MSEPQQSRNPELILEAPFPLAGQRVRYGKEPSQFIDVRLPGGEGPHPAVLLIHGGFWRVRYGLEYFGHVAADFTERGFTTFNIEYRRVGEKGGGWPGTFVDCANAIRWIDKHRREFGLSQSPLTVVGHSAGGHLAAWLAGCAHVAPTSEIATSALPIGGVVALGAVLDLKAVDALRLGNDAVRQLLGGDQHTLPDRYAAASPFDLLPLGVPQLIVHGELDEDAPIKSAIRYIKAAQSEGDEVESMLLPGVGHFEIVDPGSAIWPVVADTITNFVQGLGI